MTTTEVRPDAPETTEAAAPPAQQDPPSIQVALAGVMADVRNVAKNDRNTDQQFMFRGIDAVMNAVGPAFRKHGVVPLPSVLEHNVEYYESRRGARMRNVTLLVRYTFVGPRGDSLDVITPGEAADSSDKAYSKAMSVALRTALLQTLALPTHDRDPDADVHERASADAGSPAHGRSGTGQQGGGQEQPRQQPQGGRREEPAKPTEEEQRRLAGRAIEKVLGAATIEEALANRNKTRTAKLASYDLMPLLDTPQYRPILEALGLPGQGLNTVRLAKFAATFHAFWDELGRSPVEASAPVEQPQQQEQAG